jgi:hypothetical protein
MHSEYSLYRVNILLASIGEILKIQDKYSPLLDTYSTVYKGLPFVKNFSP